MLLSTQTYDLCRRFGDEKAIAMYCKAGYDALDYSLFAMQEKSHPLLEDDGSYAKQIRRTAEANGLTITMTHSPFAFPGMWHDMDAFYGYIVPRIQKSVKAAALLGAKAVVVHPLPHCLTVQMGEPERMRAMTIDFFKSLKPFAEAYGVKIAVENVWRYDKKRQCCTNDGCSSAAEMLSYLEELDSDCYTACLDVGHCGLIGEEAQDVIRTLGGQRITALHIQDNDYIHDQHTLPGMGKMNWDEVMKALADISYSGEFTFEADGFLTGYDNDFVGEAVSFMVRVGRMLLEKYDRYRRELSR